MLPQNIIKKFYHFYILQHLTTIYFLKSEHKYILYAHRYVRFLSSIRAKRRFRMSQNYSVFNYNFFAQNVVQVFSKQNFRALNFQKSFVINSARSPFKIR